MLGPEGGLEFPTKCENYGSHPTMITYKLRQASHSHLPLWDMTGCNLGNSTCCASFLCRENIGSPDSVQHAEPVCLRIPIDATVAFRPTLSSPVALQVGRWLTNPGFLPSLFFLPISTDLPWYHYIASCLLPAVSKSRIVP